MKNYYTLSYNARPIQSDTAMWGSGGRMQTTVTVHMGSKHVTAVCLYTAMLVILPAKTRHLPYVAVA